MKVFIRNLRERNPKWRQTTFNKCIDCFQDWNTKTIKIRQMLKNGDTVINKSQTIEISRDIPISTSVSLLEYLK